MPNQIMTVSLEFEVIPESCLRNDNVELTLGTPINQVIAALQNASKVIKNVELVYDKKDPFNRDTTITLKNDGIRLYFEPNYQLLKLIEVFDFKNITLHYCNTTFSTPNDEANVSKVENCFGATHPGVYDEGQRMYLLHWRGVSFSFPAKEPSSTVQPSYAHGLGSLNFANFSLPLLERMTIFCGNSPTEIRIPEVSISSLCGDLLLENIESITNECGRIAGLQITFRSEGNCIMAPRKVSEMERVEKIIRFADSEESVITALGSPSKIYYKSDEKMLIQRGSSSENLRNYDKSDFFFNYFMLGLDILFDYESRSVLKFVLHTNIPGHFDFAIYSRCNFSIRADCCNNGNNANERIVLSTKSILEQFRALFTRSQKAVSSYYNVNSNNYNNSDVSTNSSDAENMSKSKISMKTTKLETENIFSNKPVVLNKSSFVTGTLDSGENPFGSTFCYGTDQLIIEVMDNSHIASVIVYE